MSAQQLFIAPGKTKEHVLEDAQARIPTSIFWPDTGLAKTWVVLKVVTKAMMATKGRPGILLGKSAWLSY